MALTSDNDRDATVTDARTLADAAGFTRRPMVFDGTREISVVEDVAVASWCASERTPDRKRIWLHVGLPVAIGGSGGVSFSRMGGRHLLIVLREDRMRLGAVLVALVTAVHSSAAPPKVSIVECAGNDEDHVEDLRVLATWRDSVTWGRRRKALEPVLSQAAAEVRRRTEEDDYSAQPWIVVVSTLHRARELTGQSAYDESPGPDRDLRTILADGADVGVHLVVTADTVDTVDRRLGHDALDCFGARLLGQCSVDVSHRVLGSSEASRLGDAYALLDEPDDHRRDTVRPYPIPDHGWIAKVTTG